MGELGVFFYFTFLAWGRSRAVSSGSCAWLPFHRVSVLQPAERNVLILVRSRAFAYYLCPNAARLGNGAEIHHFLGTDVVFFLSFFPSSSGVVGGTKGYIYDAHRDRTLI